MQSDPTNAVTRNASSPRYDRATRSEVEQYATVQEFDPRSLRAGRVLIASKACTSFSDPPGESEATDAREIFWLRDRETRAQRRDRPLELGPLHSGP